LARHARALGAGAGGGWLMNASGVARAAGSFLLALDLVAAARAAAQDPLPLPRPMDLVADGADANGILLNPQWGLQQNEPGRLPDPVALCLDLPGWFENPGCTVQPTTMDRPGGAKNAICSIGATTPIGGHVNWAPATFDAVVFWDGKFSSDQDVNLLVVPPDRHGLTTASPEAIQGE